MSWENELDIPDEIVPILSLLLAFDLIRRISPMPVKAIGQLEEEIEQANTV